MKRVTTWISGLLLLFLAGCWSSQELPDLALISAVGMDATGDGQYAATFQVINPGNVAGEGTLSRGGSESPPVTTYSSTGPTMTEVNRRVSEKVSRRPYYAHTNLLVVGEQLAREEGLEKVFDAFERDPEFRTTTRVIIAEGTTAGEFVTALTSLDKIPANKVIKTLETTESFWGEHKDTNMREVLKHVGQSGHEPLVSIFTLHGDEEKGKKIDNIQTTSPEARLEATGMAVMQDGKMIDRISNEASRGALWVLDDIQKTAVSLDWKGQKDALVFQIVRNKTDVSVRIQDNLPVFDIQVSTEGEVGEAHVPINVSNPFLSGTVEKKSGEEIKKIIEQAVAKAQELQTDYLGFGELLHRKDPKLWRKLEKTWNEDHFPTVEVNVNADAYIRRSGLRNEPTFSEDVE
ncbi:spore germination protein KC [Alteribacillus persepolensis]|uniref:Spore germination protein KC n=1 Tax=Alteribacillus persepolensis TaxID=568899 RepID=A0A1G7Z3S5_9BACI|nr:Ger(x)C family spore germination protein [Alteribacillus persepolensis]SDH02800.1 spore germination protein KC [Alteribacillus persepolensis]